ncbi:hypothetical protein BGZ65_005337 [Modicella reniformis]|uniref:Uncharacterized protein n=1 Tax=Modicella reniformis TaxID=1440133 RepID=A0A9P6LYS1_9FUNG|nr:hypothetical protein BGZ65_005337 [Modicella reniformis]
MEHALEEGKKSKKAATAVATTATGQKVVEHTWLPADLTDLGLDDSQVALLLSTVLMAIESCWQREFDAKQRAEKILVGSGGGGGAFHPFQIKILGLLLLRHLDQGELDRMAKKKKPLRFRYEIVVDHHHHHQDRSFSSPSSLSPECAQQLSLQQQLQKLVESATTTTTASAPLTKDNQGDQSASQEKDTRAKTIQALEMRSQYALLLQQQVQDLVQSIDTNGGFSPAAASNNLIYLKTRAEHLAVLNLACHLVAFSIETEHQNIEGTSDHQAQDHLRRRLDILAQAVDQLIPGPGSKAPRFSFGKDLVSLDMETVDKEKEEEEEEEEEEEQLDSELNTGRIRRRRPEGVARDVADRARLIEALFLVPLSKVLASSYEAIVDSSSKPTPRTISQANQFDSPIFKTETYLSVVKQKFGTQYGVRTKNLMTEGVPMDQYTAKDSMDRTIILDWLVQVGFNTLAVTR